jgi:serine/threonine protein kinase
MASPRDQVIQLCAEFEKNTDSSRTPITVAKMALAAAKEVVPPRFRLLVTAALAVVQLAENAVINKHQCARLAGRIARINFIVLELATTQGSTDAVLKCADDLTAVFNRAVTLLEEFRVNDRSWTELSWIERVRLTHKKYASYTADEFMAIHEELNGVLADIALSDALQRLIRIAGPGPSAEVIHGATRDEIQLLRIAGPSAQEVREAAQDEMALVVEDIQSVSNLLQGRPETLPTTPFSESQRKLDPRDVIIDKNTVLGGSLTSIRSEDRNELAYFLEEFQWLKQEMEASESTDAAQEEEQAIIASPSFRDSPPRQTKFDPCDVVIDKGTRLGSGASASVFPGTLYGQNVAVKIFKTDTGITLSKVEDEVRRANHARHRNIVHVFGTVLFDDNTVGIVMELLGMSLARALECKQVAEESLRMKYTLDIIAGMQHMHQRVVHFDLKPANILLTHDRRSIKIADFGVSQTATTMDNDVPTKRGTLPYVAPELFVNPPKSSAACDVYSFAVVLAELWTGTAAWEHLGNDAGMMGYHVSMKGSRPFSPDELKTMRVPAHIVALITKCWAQEPLDRPTFAVLAKLKHTPPADWPTFLDAAA